MKRDTIRQTLRHATDAEAKTGIMPCSLYINTTTTTTTTTITTTTTNNNNNDNNNNNNNNNLQNC